MSRKNRPAPAAKVPIPHEIWILVGAAFIIALGYGLVAPIIPQFARSFDVSIAAAGAVISAFAGMRLVFAPVSGKLVNLLGSRITYLVGLSTVALSTMAVATAGDYWHVLILRALGGIGSTMFTVSAMGLIVRIAPEEIRGRASSTYATAFLLGNIIGPVVGAALSPLGMRLPFVIYGVALMVATVVVAVGLKPTAMRAVDKSSTAAPMTLAEGWRDTAYRAAVTSAFAMGWTNFGVRVAVVPLFAAATFANGVKVAGIALAMFAVGNAIALQFSGRLADSVGRRPLIVFGVALNAVFASLIGLSDSLVLLYVFSVLAGAGAGAVNPAQQASMADIIGRHRSGGTVLSTYQMAQDLGAISGPLIVGVIADHYGYGPGFAVCGLVGAVAFVAWIFGRETLPPKVVPRPV
ncbi:MFS transporter [Corynebacterium aquilae]|uniref:Arabinose ABC transporter permease n=1 Tax=Corynebacterium aquilae DSM 44791 TaxID=1431546 RepID=A0A1L7CF87_9CORY|nr:MFS transporter [Corynebacterium aquilae]APT84522.1 arabinose ABC transporter permease [Corynebacterium aquilae DSM 44791]